MGKDPRHSAKFDWVVTYEEIGSNMNMSTMVLRIITSATNLRAVFLWRISGLTPSP